MAGVKELIRLEDNGSISFGNYELNAKGKVPAFEHNGDIYKVKTFYEITKLEKNESFAYESEPGTAVTDYAETETTLSFTVEGIGTTEIVLAVGNNAESTVLVDGEPFEAGRELDGKLVLKLKLSEGETHRVEITK